MLAVMNEALAYGLIGNSVPVATMGAFLKQAVEAVLKVLPVVEVASAEAREDAAVIQTKLDKLRLPTLGEVCEAQKKALGAILACASCCKTRLLGHAYAVRGVGGISQVRRLRWLPLIWIPQRIR